MKRHMNKFLPVLCVLAIISCGKKEEELPRISNPETASEFYMYNYWIIGSGFTYAENYIKKNNERLRQTKDKCAIDIADKLEAEIEQSREALEKSRQNVIKVITQKVPEDHLLSANEYYKTTHIGKYIASDAGTAEMGKVLLTSQYKEQIAKDLEDTSLSTDDKLNLVIGYMLKMLPSTETFSYTAFRQLPIWKDLEAAKDDLQFAMKPYTDNSQDIATLSNELRNCPSMIPAPTPNAIPAPTIQKPAEPINQQPNSRP